MTFTQIEYFLEVARAGSINKAAEKLFVSQSAVSASILKLEQEFSMKLLSRSAKGIELTADGREFFSCAQGLYEGKTSMERLFSARSFTHYRKLSVATQRYPFTVRAFIDYLREAGEDGYRLHLKELGMHRVIREVSAGRSDVGVIFLSGATGKFIRRVLGDNGLEFHGIRELAPHIYVRAGHPLDRPDPPLLAELAPFPYLAFEVEGELAPDYSEEIRLMSGRPAKTLFVTDRATAYNLLQHTDCYTIGSGVLPEGFAPGGLVSRPIGDSRDAMFLGWIAPEGRPLQPEARRFIEKLEAQFK